MNYDPNAFLEALHIEPGVPNVSAYWQFRL